MIQYEPFTREYGNENYFRAFCDSHLAFWPKSNKNPQQNLHCNRTRTRQILDQILIESSESTDYKRKNTVHTTYDVYCDSLNKGSHFNFVSLLGKSGL